MLGVASHVRRHIYSFTGGELRLGLIKGRQSQWKGYFPAYEHADDVRRQFMWNDGIRAARFLGSGYYLDHGKGPFHCFFRHRVPASLRPALVGKHLVDRNG